MPENARQAWFESKTVKESGGNPLTRVVGTHFNQGGKTETVVSIPNAGVVSIHQKLIQTGKG